MKVLIILGHPNINSFNHALANACKQHLEANGHCVFFHDLYIEQFNPIHYPGNVNSAKNEDIQLHTAHLTACDALIIIHPNWWGQVPAIVKGWIDRVLLPGVAYNFAQNKQGEIVPVGLLKAKLALVLTTSNTPNNFEHDVLNTFWKHNVLNICGINKVQRINFGMVKKSDETQRNAWLLDVELLMNKLFNNK